MILDRPHLTDGVFSALVHRALRVRVPRELTRGGVHLVEEPVVLGIAHARVGTTHAHRLAQFEARRSGLRDQPLLLLQGHQDDLRTQPACTLHLVDDSSGRFVRGARVRIARAEAPRGVRGVRAVHGKAVLVLAETDVALEEGLDLALGHRPRVEEVEVADQMTGGECRCRGRIGLRAESRIGCDRDLLLGRSIGPGRLIAGIGCSSLLRRRCRRHGLLGLRRRRIRGGAGSIGLVRRLRRHGRRRDGRFGDGGGRGRAHD